ncbi:MAG: SpoIIE family protein phosphatase [Ruminiclostridium sp.]|nr:SpoIIE family protein phosphatase [Ruminiclostridium sp.]
MERSIIAEESAGKRDIFLLRGAAFFASGLILALTRLFGCPAPFAAAGLFAANGTESIFMFSGAVIGYMINGGFGVCVPYIASMGIILLIRYAVGFFLPRSKSVFVRAVCSVAAGTAVFAANLFIAEDVYGIFVSAVFGILSAGAAYCADKLRTTAVSEIFSARGGGTAAAAGVLFVMLTAALTSLQIGVINIGVLLSAAAVLYASDIRADSSAAVCAVLSSAGVAAGNGELAASCIMISVSAPVIILIGKRGRITRACVFIAVTGLGLIITGPTVISASAAISAVAAAVLYMALPDKISELLRSADTAGITGAPRPYAAFGRKLENMGAAIDEMKKAVIHTAKALEQENIRDISWVYSKTADKVCKSCPANMTCWGQMYGDTADIMNKAVDKLRKGCFLTGDMLGGHIASNCPDKARLAETLNRQYAAYCSAESSSRKVEEMRSVLTNQLGATESMLKKLGEELEQNNTYDETSAAAAEKLFSELGLVKPSVIAMRLNGKLCIDAYGTGNLSYPPEEIADRLSVELRCELDLPMISFTDGKFHITVSERARYDTEIRVFRKNKSGSRHSGDCSECFNDGQGNVYMILSDGMGSGSRARIDSAFSCSMLERLLKAGIDLESSLEMLNTSLLVKSSDESFATLDICRIDLNSGDVLLCKAGGASTYVRCGDSFREIKEEGMPLGVGFEANYRGKLFRLSEGDAIIMTSDGADPDKAWLEQLMIRDRRLDLSSVIDTLGEALRLSGGKDNEDDVTVIGVKLIK